ncbi:hypothetical protein ACFQ08_13970, partial [Streptosporangium algeriense]
MSLTTTTRFRACSVRPRPTRPVSVRMPYQLRSSSSLGSSWPVGAGMPVHGSFSIRSVRHGPTSVARRPSSPVTSTASADVPGRARENPSRSERPAVRTTRMVSPTRRSVVRAALAVSPGRPSQIWMRVTTPSRTVSAVNSRTNGAGRAASRRPPTR